ncbi:Ubiquitin-activating enzyme E1-like protein [Cyphellophora attinorum]|uniref:Ubiquitin-activating enzyme E1-like n=1 Tax=Cyphellophora attinorum TaxID=1664694 RepID=A0A0N0NKK6_9EURO|nr:Ubiquitin-activating enzyme E1-like protein [Phialophora attinorum]KPI38138.1 Ubiquitin-activating enzyme E1-like protein [Phialophora attinorum]
MPRERFVKQSLGVVQRRLVESKVLLVGAGGIGCELLKNLALTGFGEIHIIDLDTIDLSNLNRQFLFRHEHIKKSKALVAREAAQKFNPRVKLEAHHANIKDTQFDISWYSQFTLVFNALDNLEARRHVNKMCLAADVPLIESGTTGFNGQVQVIRKGITACYDCRQKEVPKSFPVCTIRSTPSQAIHCIVWAKSYLLPELFGESQDATPEVDVTEHSDNAEEIAKLKEEAEALKKIRETMGSGDFVQKVFDKVFKEDIERLAQMEDMWKDKPAPQAVSYASMAELSTDIDPSIAQYDQNIWNIIENFVVFRDSLSRLAARLSQEQATTQSGAPSPSITFDKDDNDTLDFVTATANLRAQIFGIELKSKFDVKQMAGNIIPAIATTNAMVAGLCVMQAFKVLRGDYEKTKMIFVDHGNMRPQPSDAPNPECVVCGNAMVRLQVDLERATLKDLVEDVLKGKLGYGEELSVLSEQGLIYDPDLEENLEKKFEELGVKKGSFLIIKDDEDEDDESAPRVDLQLAVEVKPDGEDADGPAVGLLLKSGEETFEVPRKAKKAKEQNEAINGNGVTNGATHNGAGDDDGVEEVTLSITDTGATATVKRKRDADEAELDTNGVDGPAKKARSDPKGKGKAVDADVVVIEEDDGTIMIDD